MKHLTAHLTCFLFLLVFLISSCEKSKDETVPIPEEETHPNNEFLSPDVHIFEDENANLLHIDSQSIEFSKGSPIVENLQVGDIIASGVFDKAPSGYLRNIVSIEETQNSILLITKHAPKLSLVFQMAIRMSPDYG